MYPASFDYSTPTTIDEALRLLSEHGDNAKLLAGGHSLLPLMKLRFAQPTHVVDLRRIPSLRGIRRDGDTLVIGAMTTHAELAASADVRDAAPIIADAAAVALERMGEQVQRVRVAVTGFSNTRLRAIKVEEALLGRVADADTIAVASMELDGGSELNDDTEAAHKIQLARVCADIA